MSGNIIYIHSRICNRHHCYYHHYQIYIATIECSVHSHESYKVCFPGQNFCLYKNKCNFWLQKHTLYVLNRNRKQIWVLLLESSLIKVNVYYFIRRMTRTWRHRVPASVKIDWFVWLQNALNGGRSTKILMNMMTTTTTITTNACSQIKTLIGLVVYIYFLIK